MPRSLIDEAVWTGIVHGKSFVLRGADVWLVASMEEAAPPASKRSVWARDSVELDLLDQIFIEDDVEDEEITELLDESQHLDDPVGLNDGYNG
eukprot:scaffold78922_cov55-Attheya_sp.AAC.1